jgi:hypothetical protein
MSSAAASLRRNPQPTRSARIARSRLPLSVAGSGQLIQAQINNRPAWVVSLAVSKRLVQAPVPALELNVKLLGLALGRRLYMNSPEYFRIIQVNVVVKGQAETGHHLS